MVISFKSLIRLALFVAAIYLLYTVRDIFFILFVALLLSFALNPLIEKLERFHIHRGLAIVFTYLFIWAFFGLIIALITPPLVQQTQHLITVLPDSLAKINLFASYQDQISQEVFSRISLLPEAVLNITIGLFSNLLTVFTTLVLAYYLVVQRKNLLELLSLLPLPQFHSSHGEILGRIENRLGNWVFGELTLMFAVGVMTFIGLKLLSIDAALPLAIIAGLLELLPNIGPTLSAVPAVLVALSVHPLLALYTVAMYFLVQFLENNFLVPNIMKKAVGINPVFSILGLMVGFRLAGPMGAIIALPTIIVIETIIQEIKK